MEDCAILHNPCLPREMVDGFQNVYHSEFEASEDVNEETAGLQRDLPS